MHGETPGLVLDMAPAEQRRHGAAPQAEPAGADQGERAAAFAEHRRDMAADQPAEGETGEVEALAGREDAGDAVGGDGGETLGRMRKRRLVGLAEPGQAGDDEAGAPRQRRDVGEPTRPRARAAAA